jgi:hypothetical protein
MAQSNVSFDGFTSFMEILDGAEVYFSAGTFDNLMLLAREFGGNSLTTRLVPQQVFPRREGNVHELFQELDRSRRGTTIEAEFQSIRDGFADVQRRLSMTEAKFDERLETVVSELNRMTELVKQPRQQRPSNQQGFIEALIEWIAMKSISFRSVAHALFQEMVQHPNPDFSVPVYNTLKHHIKRLVEVYRELPECQEKCCCPLMINGAKAFGRRFLAVTLLMEGHIRFVDLKVLNDKRALMIASSLVTVVSA